MPRKRPARPKLGEGTNVTAVVSSPSWRRARANTPDAWLWRRLRSEAPSVRSQHRRPASPIERGRRRGPRTTAWRAGASPAG
jgi:hypothetical protein